MDCPRCASENVIKKGKRKIKTGEEQLYFCKDCQTKFVDRPLKNKSYSAQVIVKALQYYYGGSSLAQTATKVSQDFDIDLSRSTVHNWTQEYQDLCSFSRLRDRYRSDYSSEFIKEHEVSLNGGQQSFKVHQAKLSRTETRQPQLANYLNRLQNNEVDIVNNNKEDKLEPDWAAGSVYQTEDKICRLAQFALKSFDSPSHVKEEQARSCVQDFLLACDSRTIATRLPIPPRDQQEGWPQVDLLQEKVGKVFLLSYQPATDSSQQLRHLYRQAKMLSSATDISLGDFRAAWFDQGTYREFKPSDLK